MTKDDRLYAPFDIGMDEHPKIIGLSDAAFRALFEGVLYSRRRMSDGFLDARIVLRKWGQEVADELSSNDPDRPSWIPVENGWQIRDFEKHHPLRSEIEEKRAKVSESKSLAGKRSGEVRRAKAEQNANTNEQDSNKTGTKTNPETETETETESKTSPSNEGETTPRKRAGRLDPQWNPPTSLIEQMSAECKDVNLKDEHRVFVDYWIAQPGQRGVKADWEATWRNWIRRKQGDLAAGTKKRPDPDAWMQPRPTAAQRNLATVAHFEQQALELEQ